MADHEKNQPRRPALCVCVVLVSIVATKEEKPTTAVGIYSFEISFSLQNEMIVTLCWLHGSMEDMICSNDWPIFEKKKNLVPNFRPEKKKLETCS
jgi:hypothetical protein